MFRSVRRKIPWMLAFEAAMAMRRHWNELPPADRRRLTELARRSGGRWTRLTREERADFKRIARGLNFGRLARELMPLGRRYRSRRHH
jgi:hypothetical protein